ncbi:MAG: response regulator [Ardenticatenaceae bacterium]|nr:response regulator [Ardenticatenaceae bacterium]
MTDSHNHMASPALVLIIDDARENRLLLTSQLKLEGFRTIEAASGREGIEKAITFDPDVILLDVMMPDLDGFEVCRLLKADPATQQIPIIMVTALNRVESRIEGKRAGADEFLSRPHVREELLVRVRTYTEVKRTRLRLDEERNRLQLLYNVSRAISSQLDLDTIMADTLTQTQAAVGATKGNIILVNEAGQVYHRFMLRAGSPVEISDHVAQAVMTQGLGGWLLENQKSEIIEDISGDTRWITLPDDRGEVGSAIGIPLIGADRVEGILVLNHAQTGYFSAEHRHLLEAIASTVTAAIVNARLFAEVREEQRKLETILTSSTDAIIITDEAWRISLFNYTAARLFQVRMQDVIGRPLTEIPHLAPLRMLLPKPPLPGEVKEVALDDGRVLHPSISPIDGVGYALILQDISELKRIEELKLAAERQEKERVQETFARYMGPRLVNHVLANAPELMARRERRLAVVMFVDLRNWTGGMITRVAPDEAIRQLNEFFTRMMDIAIEFDGTVFELTGDEILVGFNAPFDQPDATSRAVQTAVTMQREFNQLRQRWFEQAGTELGLGIGIDMGEVVMGNVGAESRMSFRMVGQPMNTASRLVDLAGDGQIVISAAVYHDLALKDTARLQETAFDKMEPVHLQGIAEPQILYRATIPRTPFWKEKTQATKTATSH